MSELLEVRCPCEVVNKKTNESITCNKLVVKVKPGSSGEIKCNDCKQIFEFEINKQKP